MEMAFLSSQHILRGCQIKLNVELKVDVAFWAEKRKLIIKCKRFCHNIHRNSLMFGAVFVKHWPAKWLYGWKLAVHIQNWGQILLEKVLEKPFAYKWNDTTFNGIIRINSISHHICWEHEIPYTKVFMQGDEDVYWRNDYGWFIIMRNLKSKKWIA